MSLQLPDYKLLVLGTTPYTEVLIDMFEALENVSFTACVENLDPDNCLRTLAGLPVLWHQNLAEYRLSHHLICSLGTTRRADWIKEMENAGFRFATLVHPSSVVSRKTALGAGVLVDAGTVIAGFSQIAPHVRVGRRASIGHHSTIGSFSTLHPASVISGNCSIGEKVTIGSGAIIIDGITIGAGAVIAAGSVVIKDVPEKTLIAGNPASVKRFDYGPK